MGWAEAVFPDGSGYSIKNDTLLPGLYWYCDYCLKQVNNAAGLLVRGVGAEPGMNGTPILWQCQECRHNERRDFTN